MSEKDLAEIGVKMVKKWILQGWIAGLISCFVALYWALLGASGHEIYSFNLFSLLDVFLILILTYGIYKKSRVASTSMFTYYTISQIFMIVNHGIEIIGIPFLLFSYLYFQAMTGTFVYKKTIEDIRAQDELDKEDASEFSTIDTSIQKSQY